MEFEQLTQLINEQLEELKAIDIKIIDVRGKTSIADAILVCSGRSSRHIQAIAQKLIEQLKQQRFPPLSSSGLNNSEWALIDFGDVIVHIMSAEARAFYNIEGLWTPSCDIEIDAQQR